MARMKLQLIAANIPEVLDRLNTWGITVYDYDPVDEITAVFSIDDPFYGKIVNLDRYGCKIKILQDVRISYLDIIKRRWILLAGTAIIIFFTIILPTKVLFFRVEGAATLPEKLILEKAEACGIYFGANRRDVRSERVKNQLLQLLPQLKWAGINTYGCVTVISVQERQLENNEKICDRIGNIVSTRDGIVQSITVLQGSSLCQPGQAVQKGEILISGYTDCGSSIRAETARGEIYALTNRTVTAIIPHNFMKKVRIISDERKFALLIGKKRINLYKDSGILDGTCDKMYLHSYMMLPGGFQLPLALIQERRIIWETEPVRLEKENAEILLCNFSPDYLRSQMVAGKILSSDQSINHQEDHSVLFGSYACSEMIGQILYEERFQSNGENN